MSDETMEQEIVDKGLTAPRVTFDRIQELVEKVHYEVNVIPNTTITQVTALLDGFSLCMAEMACVDPANFDADLGRKYGIIKAKRMATDKLRELEGYALKFHSNK